MFQNLFSGTRTAENTSAGREPLQQQRQQHHHQQQIDHRGRPSHQTQPSSSTSSNSATNPSTSSREGQSSSTNATFTATATGTTSQQQQQQQHESITTNYNYYDDNYSTMVFPSRSREQQQQQQIKRGRRSQYQHPSHQHHPGRQYHRPSTLSTTTIASQQQQATTSSSQQGGAGGNNTSSSRSRSSNSNDTINTGNTSMENNYMPETDDDDDDDEDHTDEYYQSFPRQRSPGSPDHHSSSASSNKKQPKHQQPSSSSPSQRERSSRRQLEPQQPQNQNQETTVMNFKDIMGFDDFWIELQMLVRELYEYCKLKSWKKKILTGIFAVIACLVFYDLIWGGYIVAWMENFIWWMTYHTNIAVFAFIGVFMISTLIFIPPALLLFGAGYSFSQAIGISAGIPAAVMSCFLGSGLGAIIAFVRARYMERQLIYLFSNRYPIVRAADRALKQNGFRIMLLLRLCPIIPFNGLNYCCGVTGVSTHDFITSLVGILPFQIYTISVGATAGMLSLETHRPKPNGEDNNYQHQFFGWIILLISGLIFGLLGVVYMWKLVKQELAKELHISKDQLREYLHRHSSTTSVLSPIEKDLEQPQRQYHHHQGIEAQFLSPIYPNNPNNDNSNDQQQQQQQGEAGEGLSSSPEVQISEDDAEEWFWVWA